MINMKNQNMIGCWSGTVESWDGYTNCKIKNEKEIIIWNVEVSTGRSMKNQTGQAEVWIMEYA